MGCVRGVPCSWGWSQLLSRSCGRLSSPRPFPPWERGLLTPPPVSGPFVIHLFGGHSAQASEPHNSPGIARPREASRGRAHRIASSAPSSTACWRPTSRPGCAEGRGDADTGSAPQPIWPTRRVGDSLSSPLARPLLLEGRRREPEVPDPHSLPQSPESVPPPLCGWGHEGPQADSSHPPPLRLFCSNRNSSLKTHSLMT